MSGVTPTYLLAASMVAKLISYIYLQAGIGRGLKQGSIVWQTNTLLIELCQLGYFLAGLSSAV